MTEPTAAEAPLTNGLGIGWAVKQMQQGARVCRAGWNGKGMWITLIRHPGDDWSDGREQRSMLPFVAMKTAPGPLVPWLCSQTDLLATDWELVTR